MTIRCINIIKKSIAISLLLGGITGSILFFPLLLEEGYTCLYHRIFAKEHPVNFSKQKFGLKKHSASEAEQQFLHHYFNHYIFLWWFSLTVTALVIWKWDRFGPSNRQSFGPLVDLKMHSAANKIFR